MTQNAKTTEPVISTSVSILVTMACLVERMPSVHPPVTGLFANVQQDGQETHPQNASNVRFKIILAYFSTFYFKISTGLFFD
jgi:hypothetical protein